MDSPHCREAITLGHERQAKTLDEMQDPNSYALLFQDSLHSLASIGSSSDMEPLTPLSTPSPSIRIDDAMSDVSALSPYTPLLSINSPTSDTSQHAPLRSEDSPGSLSISPSIFSLGFSRGSFLHTSPVPHKNTKVGSKAGYRAKAQGLQFKLPATSFGDKGLLSPIDAIRQQEVYPLPSPMARDLRLRAEAEVDTTSSYDEDEYSFATGNVEFKPAHVEPSCLGLDLGLPVPRASAVGPDYSYMLLAPKAQEEEKAMGVEREPGVEIFRARLMQAIPARNASAELVSSPDKSSTLHLSSPRSNGAPKPPKRSPKTTIPLPETHLESPFSLPAFAKQVSAGYTSSPLPQFSTLTSVETTNTSLDNLRSGISFGSRPGGPLPPSGGKPSRRNTYGNQNTLELMHDRMHGCTLFPQHFPAGYLLEATFAQHFRLETELGAGGYGFVLSARNLTTGEEVAVKFINRNQIQARGLVRDHNNHVVPLEAVVLQIAQHPGVVQFRGLYEDNFYFYLVQELHGDPWSKNSKNQNKYDQVSSYTEASSEMQPDVLHCKPPYPVSAYAPTPSSPLRGMNHSSSVPVVPTLGQLAVPLTRNAPRLSLPLLTRPPMPRRASYDLFECIEQHQRLSEGQAKYIFAQVVDTVYYLDSIGITHRDIKDENLVIDKNFKVKVIDFGSAVIRDIRKPPPTYRGFFGTMTFASHEILNDHAYTAPPAEVWTLGILLSFLVTGQSPFHSLDDAKHGTMSSANAAMVVSPLCWDLMHKCLELDPVRRLTIRGVRDHPWLCGALDRA